MEPEPRLTIQWGQRATRWACMACLGVMCGVSVPAPAADAGARETTRRTRQVEEAQELLRKGDEAYQSANYETAIEAYAGARETLPVAPLTAELKSAATERLVNASIARARELSRKGDVPGAKKVMERVLDENVAPDDPAARAALRQLEDPVRTNPALTAEHGADIDQVRRLLYTAEGSFNLGKYDEAIDTWNKVLRIDPANKAARRGMERAAAAKSDYFRAAHDEARASMLSEVDASWLPVVPTDEEGPRLPAAGSDEGFQPGGGQASVAAKLQRIVIPMVDFDDSSLVEAVDALRAMSIELDDVELEQSRKGVSIVVETGSQDPEAAKRARDGRFSLRLRGVPLGKVLDYISQATGFRWSVEEFAVVFRSSGSMSKAMISRTYRVPPDFLSLGGQAPAAAQPADPFAEKPAQEEGLLAKRLSAREVLEGYGVKFPEGATASFNATNSTLTVRNSPDMHLLIEQIVETAATTEPVQVVVRVTMMKTEESRLQELGFDWLLDNFETGGSAVLTGGTVGNSHSLMSDVTPLPGQQSIGNPITAGNRSGAQAERGDAIDTMLSSPRTGAVAAPKRAPGVMAVHGTFDNSRFTAVMRGLSQSTGIDFISVPSTVTRSGQRALVQVVRELIYPTEYEQPQVPNTVGFVQGAQTTPTTPSMPTAFEKRDVGVFLEVEPTVSSDRRYVDLMLNPSLTEFEGFVNYGSPITSAQSGGLLTLGAPQVVELTPNEILMPVFSVNRANTALTVADGATVVIGGLLQQKMVEVQDSVPILGNLPLVGRLFQSKVSAPQRKAVFFFVTVELLDPAGHPFRHR